jgi:secondary thiamine-phosphate synthase enzyme
MAEQHTLHYVTHGHSTHEITRDIAAIVQKSEIDVGVVHLFVRHTSCGLALTENADPDVRRDLQTLLGRWAPDGDPEYRHRIEGDDDMAAHARSVLTGCSVSLPFAHRHLLLGHWQGIYLFEHRAQGHRREVIVTLLG